MAVSADTKGLIMIWNLKVGYSLSGLNLFGLLLTSFIAIKV